MKFAEHLTAHITPEWRKQYIQYEEMKSMLYKAIEEAPSPEHVEPKVLARYFASFDEVFFTFCDKELNKINTFYAEKLAEATRKSATLKSELTAAQEPTSSRSAWKMVRFGQSGNSEQMYKVPARKMQNLKLAFSEYYLSLVLLQNYQNLNYTGFRKILKKHDKNMNTDTGIRWRTDLVDTAFFYSNKDIDKLIHDTESTFTKELELGDRQKAMKRLRVPPLGDHQSPWTTFKVGLFSGAFVVLIIAVVLSSIYHDFHFVEPRDDWKVIVRLYRGPLLIIIFLFLLGINVYGWRSSGVNHVLIFELDPRNHLSEQHFMELAAILGVIWSLSVLMFLYSGDLLIPAYANPLALFLLMFMFLFNPTKTFRHEARFWFLRVLGRVVMAPFFYVGFADFWIGDQLNSLAPAIKDLHYTVCFYANAPYSLDGKWSQALDDNVCVMNDWFRPIVSCLPAWFRFAQCLRRYRDTKEAFPHLVNAGKYSTTFFVILFATLNTTFSAMPTRKNDDDDGDMDGRTGDANLFFYFWIAALILSSLYAYMWDIKMDWGLFDKNAGENTFLREEVVYGSKNYYYFAIVEDFILRFGWTISLSLIEKGYVHGELITTILAPLEVFRRFVWNFIRLENEHLNNCGKFRAVRDISVAPIDATDQSEIIKMMDERNGVFLVRKRKVKKDKRKPEILKPLLETEVTRMA